MTDEEYKNRSDTVLAYKKANEIGRFSKAAAEAEKEPLPEHIKVNDRCKIHPSTTGEIERLGHVRYVGKTSFSPGNWIGVELDEPVGKNDGWWVLCLLLRNTNNSQQHTRAALL